MFTSDTLLVAVAVVLRILVTAAILAPCARYILQVRPTPYGRSLLIAAAAQLLAKGADELFQWPLEVVGLIPGLVMLVLAYLVFNPRFRNSSCPGSSALPVTWRSTRSSRCCSV